MIIKVTLIFICDTREKWEITGRKRYNQTSQGLKEKRNEYEIESKAL